MRVAARGRDRLPAPRTTLFSGAAATLLLGASLQLDHFEHTLVNALLGEWLAPTAGIMAAAAASRLIPPADLPGAASDRAAIQGLPNDESLPLPLVKALERDSDSLVLSLPACLVLNAALLSVLQLSGLARDHAHVLCWAGDWAAAVPAVLLLRNQATTDEYRYDDPADRRAATKWSTSGEPIFRRPSEMSASTEVQVREHRDGWRTLRFVETSNGAANIQSVARLVGPNTVDPQAVANEYLKVMAAAALACVAPLPSAEGPSPRLLFLGLGGGTLPVLLSDLLPSAEVSAVELDGAVVDAATSCLGVRLDRIEVVTADALQWARQQAAAAEGEAGRFDLIFVDIFDSDNVTPAPFYSAAFLADVRTLLSPRGVALTNLHTGSPRLDDAFSAATAEYRRAFKRVSAVPVNGQGNTILAATPSDAVSLDPASLAEAARRSAREASLVTFDAARRVAGARAL